VEFPTAVAFQRTQAAGQTRIAATIGTAGRVEILWTPRTKRANEVAATIFVENNSLVTLANGVMDVRSTLNYQISQANCARPASACPKASGSCAWTANPSAPGNSRRRKTTSRAAGTF